MRNFLLAVIISLMSLTVQAAATAPAANPFTLNTTAFLDQGTLPVLYTCDGKNISPEFDWTNVPAKAQTFVLIMTDPTAPGGTFYHWIVYNIPKSTVQLPQGIDKLPSGALAGKNSWGKPQYGGPCPPKGSAHSYIVTVYALDTKLTLPAGAEGQAVLDAMQKHIVGKVALTAIYSRWLT
jgi:hypothetical protein